ncbi:DUF2141 domain-containing protein [Telluria beijingensis]|uniref:DUF2141 domain-containing protein n=1 Tax=Telluria beijingensis TaxID=3068633 RepID=UPI0027959F15|nr:DUF2141 domain-containing protein [Massilia sp. REN29]
MKRLALLLALLSSAACHAADLSIRVDGVRADGGAVRVALFDSADRFLKRPLQTASAPAREGVTTLEIKDLATGQYAIAVYHDANDNGKLDQNMMGIPVEATGFSNDALGNMGPPAFEAARFALPAEGNAIRVTLR